MKTLNNFVLYLSIITIICFASIANAAQKNYVILPFTVNAPQNYAYLGKAVPATVQSQINRPGSIEGKVIQAKASSNAEAKKSLSSASADYAIWGSINVLGNDCTIEMNCIDKSGKTWTKSAQGPMSRLTGTLQQLTSSLGKDVLGVNVAVRPAFQTPENRNRQGSSTQMNSDIVVNETGQQQVYLNPQFRYQGAGASDGSRLRSQRIKTKMVDMAVGDFTGDGKNEIAIIDDHKLFIYTWPSDGRLKEIASTTISQSNTNFSMRAMDLNNDSAKELIITTFQEDDNRPYSYFYTAKGGKLSQFATRIPYFASVISMPPNFKPTLVGQGWDSVKLFSPGVHLLVKNGDKYSLGSRISLPSQANVFNCVWIPASKESKSDQLVMLTDEERIKLFQGSFDSPIHTTMERFSGSATGMDHFSSVSGMTVNKNVQLAGKYYAPMRMIATDLGRTGEYVLLINKPISTASQIFDRYRYFPQGEIHALYWDGVGLGLKWKTRRIRGSVASLDLADANNDGILDLVVGLNTSPDLGIGSRQSMITAYPLDVSQQDPNMPADLSDFEINPNR